ncbi:MAG: hypothetical protein HQL82_16850 [Magnetococcales bacterium]|nr:hypothetical protein [Magnetococcales bacterium]
MRFFTSLLLALALLSGCQKSWNHSLFQGDTGKPAVSIPDAPPGGREAAPDEETPDR